MEAQDVKQEILGFIAESFLFGDRASLPAADESLIERGLIDSTGVLELIAFLEGRYQIVVADEEMIPENLDSVVRIAAFIEAKVQRARTPQVA